MAIIEPKTLEFASLENFDLAFERISRSTRFEVKDWLALQVYAWPEYKHLHLKSLIEALSDYQPSLAHNIYLPKQDYSLRRFAFLSMDDRIVYQALGNYLIQNTFDRIRSLFEQKRVFANIPTLPSQRNAFVFEQTFSSYNPRTRRTTVGSYDLFRDEVVKARDASLRNFATPWMIKTDISNFYGEVNHNLLIELLAEREWLTDDALIQLLMKCLDKWKETEYAKGLPVGYETSDYLANLLLTLVDEALQEFDVKRYVDDMYIFVQDFQEAKRAIAKLDYTLSQLGLRRNGSKTELICVQSISEDALVDKLGKTLSFLAHPRSNYKAEGKRQQQLHRFFWNYYSASNSTTNFCDKSIIDVRKLTFALYRLKVPDSNVRNAAFHILEYYPNYAFQVLTYIESNFSQDHETIVRLKQYLDRDYESTYLRFLCLKTLANTAIGINDVVDVLIFAYKFQSDWFMRYGLLRNVFEKNLVDMQSNILSLLREPDEHPVVRAYVFWLAAQQFPSARAKIVDLALQDGDVFIKKLGMYLWRYFNVTGVRLTLLPASLREQYLDGKLQVEIQDFHTLFKQVFNISLHPNFPIEKAFGDLNKLTEMLRAIWGAKEQGMDLFILNMYQFVVKFLNAVAKIQHPNHKYSKSLPTLRNQYFDTSLRVDTLRILESYWDELKLKKRLKNGGQAAILENVNSVIYDYINVLSRHYLGVTMRTDIFICYSHQDSKWRDRIKTHLQPYIRNTPITTWDDTKIKAGADWNQAIRSALQRAKIAILLVSADFMASDYINDQELPEIFTASEKDGLTIMWIAVKPTKAWKRTALSKIQCAHNNPQQSLLERPEHEQETVFAEIAETISNLLDVSPKN